MKFSSGLQREYSRSMQQTPRNHEDLRCALVEVLEEVIAMHSRQTDDAPPSLDTTALVSFLKSIKQEASCLPACEGRSLLVGASTIAVVLSAAWNDPELLVSSISHLNPSAIQCEDVISACGKWDQFVRAVFRIGAEVPHLSVCSFQRAAFVLYAAFADEESLSHLLAATTCDQILNLVVPASLIVCEDIFSLLVWCEGAHPSVTALVAHLLQHTLRRRLENDQLGSAFRPQCVASGNSLPLPAEMRLRLGRLVQL